MIMSTWYPNEEEFKDKVGVSKYMTTTFSPPVQYLTIMLCWLHSEEDSTHLKSN